MLLLFILIGALAIGLPLMMILMNESPPPPEPPPRPAVIQPVTTSAMPEAPQANTSSAADAEKSSDAHAPAAASPVPSGETALAIPGAAGTAQSGAASPGHVTASGSASG